MAGNPFDDLTGTFSGFGGANLGNFDAAGFDAARAADFELTSFVVELGNALQLSPAAIMAAAAAPVPATVLQAALAMEAPGMSILDSIVTGIGSLGSAIGSGIEKLAMAAVPIVQTVQTVQSVINGGAQTTMTAPSAAMMAAMMATGGGAVTQGSDAQAAFRAACEMDPSCKAAVIAALQGGGATMNMMNGGTAGSLDAQLAQLSAAGLPAGLIMALKGAGPSALATLRSLLPGLAVGVGTTIGLEALTGALPSAMSGTRLPRRIQVPDGKGGVREYVSRGRPLLYSGDVAAVRRVAAIAKRARSSRPRRRLPVAQQVLLTHAPCGRCLSSPCSCPR